MDIGNETWSIVFYLCSGYEPCKKNLSDCAMYHFIDHLSKIEYKALGETKYNQESNPRCFKVNGGVAVFDECPVCFEDYT